MLRIFVLLLQTTLLYITIFLLIGFLLNRKKLISKPDIKISSWPLVSFAVPAFNEEKNILKCLKSILDLDYPKNKLEIIIINDASSDKTSSIVKKFIYNKKNIILIDKKVNEGKAKGLNDALKIAKGKFFISVDGDSFPEKNTLKEVIKVFYKEGERTGAVVPLITPVRTKNFIERAQKIEYAVAFISKFFLWKIGCICVVNGPFAAIRKNVLRNIGGYSEETLTEDVEIALRLQKYNYKIGVANCHVKTVCPTNLGDLFKQRKRWDTGTAANYFKYGNFIKSKKGDFSFMMLFYWISIFSVSFFLLVNFLAPLSGLAYLSFLSDYSVPNVLSWFEKSYIFSFLFGFTITGYLVLLFIYLAWFLFFFFAYKDVLKQRLSFKEVLSGIQFLLFYNLFIACTKFVGVILALFKGDKKW